MKTARDCALILTVFTFASGMRYVTDEDYSHSVSLNVGRLLQQESSVSISHDPVQSRLGLKLLHNVNMWLRRPSRQVVADYGLALNPLPEAMRLAYAGEQAAGFNTTANTFTLWIPQPDN